MPSTKWIGRHFFGARKSDGQRIYISAPSWDCGWYWSFGYLGNKHEHYHLSDYQTIDVWVKDENGKYHSFAPKRNKSMYDCLKEDYHLNKKIEANLWQSCELARTAYTLKEAAEVIGRGGSHYTTNLCQDTIINKDEVNRINNTVLPEIFDTMYKLFFS